MPSPLPSLPLSFGSKHGAADLRSPPGPRRPPTGRPIGFTLLELMTVMILLGLALSEILPPGKHLLDRMAVLGAREAAVGQIHRARMEAVARGGVRLLVETSPPTMRIETRAPSVVIEKVTFGNRVELELTRDRRAVTLSFDAMGLGRVANQTLRFTQGTAQAELLVSSFGRVTRR